MAEKIKNRIIVLEPATKLVNELLGHIEAKNVADVVRVKSHDEAFQEVTLSLPCMMILCIMENSDVPVYIQFFKKLESSIKLHGLKTYVVTPLKNRQLADLITQKMGAADFIIEPVPVRTMLFKANLQLKAVDNFRRQQEMKKLSEQKIVFKKADAKTADAALGSDVKTAQKAALQVPGDTFLIKNSAVKKNGKKFTVELDGPDPSTGEWVQHEDKGDVGSAWRWLPNEEKEKAKQGSGAAANGWVHGGDKPVFNESSQKWAMTSENPSLTLQVDGKTAAQKIGVDEKGEVFFAEDSPAAEENLKKNRAAAAKKKEKGGDKSSLLKAPGGDSQGIKSKIESGNGKNNEVENEKLKNRLAALEKMGREEEVTLSAEPIVASDEAGAKSNDSDAGVSAAGLNDRRDPENADQVKPLLEKRLSESGKNGRPGRDLNDFNFEEPKEKAAAAPLSPLDFLKKKKAALKRIPEPTPAPVEEDAGPLTAAAEEAEAPSEQKKQGKSGVKSARDRLMANFADGLAEPAEEGTAPPADGVVDESGEAEDADSELIPSSNGKPRDKETASKAKLKSLRERKKQAFNELQALLKEPLPEELATEEEAALREELGFQNSPEIKPRDLARKKRLKELQGIKGRLGELDLEIASAADSEKEAALNGMLNHDDERVPKIQSGSSQEKIGGIGQAFNGEEEGEVDQADGPERKKRREKVKKEMLLEEFQYVPESEIQPLSGGWEASGPNYYTYLDVKIRYKGFDKLMDLLPLWIFEGENVPELLDKTKQWRFLGNKPQQVKSVAEIPGEVRDFLIGLRDQLKKDRELASITNELAEADAKKAEIAEVAELMEAEAEEAEVPENTSLAGGRAKSEGKEPDAQERRLAALTDEFSTDEEIPEEGASAAQELDEAVQKAAKPNSSKKASSEKVKKFLEERKRKKELKQRGGQQAAGSESEQVPDQNAAVEKSDSAEDSVVKNNQTVPGKGPVASFLGIYVSLSNSFSYTGGQNNLPRVLAAMETSFGNCVVLCTAIPDAEGNALVLYRSPDTSFKDERVMLTNGLSEAILRTNGESMEVLGYLFLRATGGRQSFNEMEEQVVRKMVGKLWPLMLRDSANPGTEEATGMKVAEVA